MQNNNLMKSKQQKSSQRIYNLKMKKMPYCKLGIIVNQESLFVNCKK